MQTHSSCPCEQADGMREEGRVGTCTPAAWPHALEIATLPGKAGNSELALQGVCTWMASSEESRGWKGFVW